MHLFARAFYEQGRKNIKNNDNGLNPPRTHTAVHSDTHVAATVRMVIDRRGTKMGLVIPSTLPIDHIPIST